GEPRERFHRAAFDGYNRARTAAARSIRRSRRGAAKSRQNKLMAPRECDARRETPGRRSRASRVRFGMSCPAARRYA
ncbi:hypothetical protein, partial [Burkholderia mallei]|uniref:hypothetical protein n=1 Tax=Burkholderia mallei TaxID=13373 RepID=UPI001C4A0005